MHRQPGRDANHIMRQVSDGAAIVKAAPLARATPSTADLGPQENPGAWPSSHPYIRSAVGLALPPGARAYYAESVKAKEVGFVRPLEGVKANEAGLEGWSEREGGLKAEGGAFSSGERKGTDE